MDGEPAPETTPRQTVAALFDDTMDAEQALAALRKDESTERVSLIVRSAATGDERPPVDLAQALVARALDAVGAWLSGLAQLVVPDRGEYLVAGPLGAALVAAGAPSASGSGGAERISGEGTSPQPDLVRGVLTAFGFGDDEATYLERRLEAGAALIAVTDDRHDAVQDVQRLFADHAAVYLGLAHTDARLVDQVEALLADAPQLIPSGDVIIADAAAPLHKASSPEAPLAVAALIGRPVLDERDDAVGDIDDVLFEAPAVAAAKPVPRYLIVGTGGLLGVGRTRVAVPASITVTLDDGRIRVAASAEAIHNAPAADQAPFSRRDEQATHRHFDTAPDWAADRASRAANRIGEAAMPRAEPGG
jgi:PRC-barrel domain protein